MQITKTKYSTYFFKEHQNIDEEKNTFSAFIPDGKKGFWALTEDVERRENIAKIAIECMAGLYFNNNEVSEDNVINLLNSTNKEIIENKIKKNMDYYGKFSISVILAKDSKMVIGNIGESKTKLFRNNEIIETITGDSIVTIELKKYDYILSGTLAFWDIINENEVLDIFIRNSSRFGFESELSRKVSEAEIRRRIEIPFLSIFVENLEEEKIEEYNTIIVTERVNPLNYVLPFLILIFFVTAIGKTIQNNKIEKQKKEQAIIEKQKQKEKEKALAKEVSNSNNHTIIIPSASMTSISTETAYSDSENLPPQNEEEQKIEELSHKNQNIEVKLPTEPKKNVEPVKRKNIEKKNNKTSNTKPKTTKNSSYSIDEEIRQNWKKLGRDENGNIINN